MSVCLSVCHISDALQLDLQTTVSHPTLVLGTRFRSSGRAVITHKGSALSSPYTAAIPMTDQFLLID